MQSVGFSLLFLMVTSNLGDASDPWCQGDSWGWGCCSEARKCIANGASCKTDKDCMYGLICSRNYNDRYGKYESWGWGLFFDVYVCVEPTEESGIRLYEGNSGTQDVVCDISSSVTHTFYNFQETTPCSNDEARSMVINFAKANTVIKLFDDPEGRPNIADVCVVKILRDIKTPLLIPSFEPSYYQNLFTVKQKKKRQVSKSLIDLVTFIGQIGAYSAKVIRSSDVKIAGSTSVHFYQDRDDQQHVVVEFGLFEDDMNVNDIVNKIKSMTYGSLDGKVSRVSLHHVTLDKWHLLSNVLKGNLGSGSEGGEHSDSGEGPGNNIPEPYNGYNDGHLNEIFVPNGGKPDKIKHEGNGNNLHVLQGKPDKSKNEGNNLPNLSGDIPGANNDYIDAISHFNENENEGYGSPGANDEMMNIDEMFHLNENENKKD